MNRKRRPWTKKKENWGKQALLEKKTMATCELVFTLAITTLTQAWKQHGQNLTLKKKTWEKNHLGWGKLPNKNDNNNGENNWGDKLGCTLGLLQHYNSFATKKGM